MQNNCQLHMKCIKLIVALLFSLANLAVHAQVKIIPGWAWGDNIEFETPEEACIHAFKVPEINEWTFAYMKETDNPINKDCYGYREDYGYIHYTGVSQMPCPSAVPKLATHFLTSGLRLCTTYRISINGSSVTKALPEYKSEIPLRIEIIAADGPVPNWGFLIYSAEFGFPNYTDNSGGYDFLYIPPLFKNTSVELFASCDYCENIANKKITVISPELTQEPQMCRR